MLEPKKKALQDTFVTQYCRCVFTTRNTSGIEALLQEIDPLLDNTLQDFNCSSYEVCCAWNLSGCIHSELVGAH